MGLTSEARDLADQRVIGNYIVKAKDGRYQEVLEIVEQLDLISAVSDSDRKAVEQLSSSRPKSLVDSLRPGVILDKGVNGYGPIGSPTRRKIDSFNMVASSFSRDLVREVAKSTPVDKVFPDKQNYAFFNTVSDDKIHEFTARGSKNIFTDTVGTTEAIGAVDVFHDERYMGDGVKVSVLDTAGTHDHPQTSHMQFESVMNQSRDYNGHGVWCAACIGGSEWNDDRLSNQVDGEVVNRGVAPSADILGVKCLGHVVGTGDTSQIIQAIERAIEWDADVISLSLGAKNNEDKPEEDPYYEPMQEAVDQGIIPVIAAGNSGPEENTVGTPGWLPNVLTVGAYDPINNKVAEYSSRGPTNDGRVKPDVIAPGSSIDSGAVGVLDGSENIVSKSAPISGTSMATPHVSGLLALAMDYRRTEDYEPLTLGVVKETMREIAVEEDRPVKNNKQGWGEMEANDLVVNPADFIDLPPT